MPTKVEGLSAADFTLYSRYRDNLIRAADKYRTEKVVFGDKTNLTMSIRDVQDFVALLQKNEFLWKDLDGPLQRAVQTLGFEEFFGDEVIHREFDEANETLIGPPPVEEKSKPLGFLERFLPRRR